MSIASAGATGPAFESLFILFFILSRNQLEIRGKLLKVDFQKMWTDKPDKTVFLAILVIYVDIGHKG